MRQSATGTDMASFSVAVNAMGDKPTLFIDCISFGQAASFVLQYLKQGSAVVVDGKISLREYTNSAGVNKTSLQLACDEVYSLGGKKREEIEVPELEAESVF